MQPQSIVLLLFAVLALIAGMGLLFVRINPDQLRASFRTAPALALFRFRTYRYAMATLCLAVAALAAAIWAGLV